MGYLNLWFWQERYRQKSIKASGTPIADCYKYFDGAFKIFPNNMVHRGFGSNCLMLNAELDGNDALMAKATLEAIFQTLPVELTFVDKNDTFVFFSHLQGAIFTRSTATLGTRVQNCHPPKSLHLVNKILQEFKAGTRDVAEFWINFQGKILHIRYFAVRDSKGQYLGSLEVTQDITEIQKIKGDKRLA